MTRSEYQDLMEFLGPKFDAIDRRFDAIDRRFDAIEERLIRIELLMEDTRYQLQILAEEVAALRNDFRVECRALRSEMAGGFDAQGRMPRGLGSRVGILEA